VIDSECCGLRTMISPLYRVRSLPSLLAYVIHAGASYTLVGCFHSNHLITSNLELEESLKLYLVNFIVSN